MNHLLVRAEINLKNIAHNIAELRRITDSNAKLLIAVKANGYGHGIREIAQTAVENGADALGVARIEEAVTLREAGIRVPILILGHTLLEAVNQILKYDLSQTVSSYAAALALSKAAKKAGKKIRVHIKIDTGMGRLGILSDALSLPTISGDKNIEEIKAVFDLPDLLIEGIYTHFARAEYRDKSSAEKQFKIFSHLLDNLQIKSNSPVLRHAANSAAIIDMPATHLDMVRAGISVYGLYPSDQVDRNKLHLKPAMAIKSRIIHIKDVPQGFKVSYGSTWETPGPTRIATVPIGYGDGYSRLLSSKGHMLVRGRKAPIAGIVCMDLTMIDVGHIADVDINDEVVIMGDQGDASVSAGEIAKTINTNTYEIVTTITDRVPRVYLK